MVRQPKSTSTELDTISNLPLHRQDISLGLMFDRPPQMGMEEKIGLVEAVGTRGGSQVQKVAIRLLQGWPRSMAVLGTGMSEPQLRDLCKRDSVIREILTNCEEAGFNSRIVTELYDRALAGKDDRGSLRALEIVAKSRGPQFNEKVAHTHHLAREAESSRMAQTSGWQNEDAGEFE